jgi:hypothetical protein
LQALKPEGQAEDTVVGQEPVPTATGEARAAGAAEETPSNATEATPPAEVTHAASDEEGQRANEQAGQTRAMVQPSTEAHTTDTVVAAANVTTSATHTPAAAPGEVGETPAFATPVSSRRTACTTRAGSAAYATVTASWVSSPPRTTTHGEARSPARSAKPTTPHTAPLSRAGGAPNRPTARPARGATRIPATPPGSR